MTTVSVLWYPFTRLETRLASTRRADIPLQDVVKRRGRTPCHSSTRVAGLKPPGRWQRSLSPWPVSSAQRDTCGAGLAPCVKNKSAVGRSHGDGIPPGRLAQRIIVGIQPRDGVEADIFQTRFLHRSPIAAKWKAATLQSPSPFPFISIHPALPSPAIDVICRSSMEFVTSACCGAQVESCLPKLDVNKFAFGHRVSAYAACSSVTCGGHVLCRILLREVAGSSTVGHRGRRICPITNTLESFLPLLTTSSLLTWLALTAPPKWLRSSNS